jgi:hypothetical protein
VNFLADESVDRQIVDRLRQEGHTVRYVAEMEPGIGDDIVLGLARRIAHGGTRRLCVPPSRFDSSFRTKGMPIHIAWMAILVELYHVLRNRDSGSRHQRRSRRHPATPGP